MPPLLKLILIRVGLGLLTLFLVSVVVFAATQALPGDTARAILGKEAADKARYEALRKQLGLDRPIHEQYIEWLGGVVTGDMGDSLVQDEPVTKLLGRRVVNTFTLVFVAAVLSVPISLLLGSLTALKRDTLFDTSITVGSLSLAALPEFVIGIALILFFATQVLKGAMPAVSRVDPGLPIYQQLKLFILPAVTLTLAVAPYILRILRASTIEVLESEYVMMARLKGLPERLVLNRHALPNALAPALQVTALNLAWLAGGVVVVEYLFAFPGIGSLLVDSVANRDMPMVQAICLIIAAVYVLANLTADILTILVSPRLRTGLR
ncbi:MAG: ABC transporter permease [Actinobacteria bacterium]|jgi:peptide/nickel transport system permease protein|nr:ABC transporter permease [Acidobacteriota bacterium]NLT92477.1 ABC transporter permease [Actinomycetota bacterium]